MEGSLNQILLMWGIVIFFSVFLKKLSVKMGLPMLLAFLFLGIVFGSDGIFKIPFENYSLAENICSFGLIFIMFSGGFGTSWKEAKHISKEAIVLSTLGVVLTAVVVGIFCMLVFNLSFAWGLLLGSVIGSTDAASVFSILRSRKLNLKDRTASLLEFESGSNDPMSYMMTLISVMLIQGELSPTQILSMLFAQVFWGLSVGFVVAILTRVLMRKVDVSGDGFDFVFVLGSAITAYALSSALGGNGYLSVYLTGIILGNSKIKEKKEMVSFFDGLTGLMQLVIFFLLGLLSRPSELPHVAMQGLIIFFFLTFIARPLSVFLLMKAFPSSRNRNILISFAGLRGAASIVFAILAVESLGSGDFLFHLVFFIVILSILFQGSFLPKMSKRLDMIDDQSDVMKTFTDYTEQKPVQFVEFLIPGGHSWAGQFIRDIMTPPETLIILVERNGEKVLPKGDTKIQVGDRVVIGSAKSTMASDLDIVEVDVDRDSVYANKTIAEIPRDEMARVLLIERGKDILIPRGDTTVAVGDILVMYRLNE